MSITMVVADDEKHLADTLSYAFKREGHTVYTAYDGLEALRLIQLHKPQLVLLDVSMPGLSGYEVIKEVQGLPQMGMMLLTARTDIVDKLMGLELGADDYITKPFDMREVVARGNALVRRLIKDEMVISSGSLIMKQEARSVMCDNVMIELTPKEFDLLWLLVSHENKVYSREQLIETIWGYDFVGETRTVDLHIQRLRKKCGPLVEEGIQTVHRVGYKWIGASIAHE